MNYYNNWEQYIKDYCEGFCLGMVQPFCKDRSIIIQAGRTHIVFHFGTVERKQLKGVFFFNLVSGLKIPYLPMNGHETCFIPCHHMSMNNVEGFLSIPVVKGWEERQVFIDGGLYKTEAYSKKTGGYPFYTAYGKRTRLQRLLYTFGQKETKTQRFYKGIIPELEEKAYRRETILKNPYSLN